MNMKKNFIIGMSMGLAVGAVTAYAAAPKKRRYNSITKTLHAMGDVVDSVSDYMGW